MIRLWHWWVERRESLTIQSICHILNAIICLSVWLYGLTVWLKRRLVCSSSCTEPRLDHLNWFFRILIIFSSMTTIEHCVIFSTFSSQLNKRMSLLWFAEWTEAQLVVTFGEETAPGAATVGPGWLETEKWESRKSHFRCTPRLDLSELPVWCR